MYDRIERKLEDKDFLFVYIGLFDGTPHTPSHVCTSLFVILCQHTFPFLHRQEQLLLGAPNNCRCPSVESRHSAIGSPVAPKFQRILNYTKFLWVPLVRLFGPLSRGQSRRNRWVWLGLLSPPANLIWHAARESDPDISGL